MHHETCWDLIQAVKRGELAARDDFVQRYLPVARAYVRARWTDDARDHEREDAVQEVFLRCFTDAGALERLEQVSQDGFRAFLYGLCRNVALEHERSRLRHPRLQTDAAAETPDDEERVSQAFDRALALQTLREARERFRRRAHEGDGAARRRYELLALRFEEGLPIREIAARWGEDPVRVHKEYARARREFREALLEIVAELNPRFGKAQVEESAHALLELVR